MAVQILRYLGVAKEKVFGAKKAARFHVDISSGGLDSPSDPNIHFEGGMGRYARRYVPGAYISAGGLEMAVDVSTLWYLLWLVLGTISSDKTNVTDVTDEALGSTDAEGDISGTLGNTPDTFGSLVIKDTGPDIVANDNGFGKIFATTEVLKGDTFTTDAGETTQDGALGNLPTVPGSLKVYSDPAGSPTLVAHDDGKGLVVDDAASGVTGTIDYQTGEYALTGLTESTTYGFDHSYRNGTAIGDIDYITGEFAVTGLGASEAHTGDYSHGKYKHTITPQNTVELPSETFELGKDLYEHVFPGCAINSISISVEKELAKLSVDVTGGKDEKDTIKEMIDLLLVAEFPVAFHKVKFEYADKGGAYVDISADVDSLKIDIGNNADGEGGLGLNSRYPQRAYCAGLDVSAELKIKFDDMTHKEDFWGGSTGPTETPQEKQGKVTFDAGDYGDVVCEIPRMLISSVPHTPSGRGRLEQTLSLKALYDSTTEKMIEFVCQTLATWDRTYPA